MQSEFKILLVDDDPKLVDSLTDVLEAKGYQIAKAHTAEEAFKTLQCDSSINLVVLDLILPKMSGLDLLGRVRAEIQNPPSIVMITGYGSVESAVKAIKLGALDYIEKPINPEELLYIIHREQERQRLVDQNAYFMRELSQRYKIENIVGESPAMLQIFKQVRSVAESEAPVLILGENGTGKELIANHIHYYSSRCRGPLVSVSCATLATGVLESELFGHEKGAFTGAINSKPGRFELANGGTLFMDEIGDIPLPFQAKLMRVLQFMEFERVGGTKILKSDFRIISATNHDLSKSIKNGIFRQDLYYRLNTVEIKLPPLRERSEDIPLLVNHFIQIYSKKTNKTINGCQPEFLPVLENYSWPGNVRELKNAIEHAFVYCREDVLGIQHLPRHISNPVPQDFDFSMLPTRSLARVEQKLIEQCLRESKGNKTRAAQVLGINRTTLLSKLRTYGLSADDPQDSPDEN